VIGDSLVLMLHRVVRSLEDLRELRNDDGLMNLLGRNEIQEPDTVGDWLRRMGDPKGGQIGLMGSGRVRNKINERILKREGVTRYTSYADAMEIIGEKTDAFLPIRGVKSICRYWDFYLKRLFASYDEFREGNVVPAFEQKEFYLECKRRMPKDKGIGYYRVDSASNQLKSLIS